MNLSKIINENSKAIIVLCSQLNKNKETPPLSNAEWRDLLIELNKKNIYVKDLLNFSSKDFENSLDLPIKRKRKSKRDIDKERLESLISRKGSLFFKIEELYNIGIKTVTIYDEGYPKKILGKLKEDSPPLFYYAGDITLLDKDLVGFVGSRKTDDLDEESTKVLVDEIVEDDAGVVSGGAKGIDSISTKESLEKGSFAVEFLSDSMLKKLKNNDTIEAIQNNKLLLISTSTPYSYFNAIAAMERNKYIYISSIKTMIIKSDYKKGGTWAGAVENLKKQYTKAYCRDINYEGNKELIKLGIEPIKLKNENKLSKAKQSSLSDFE